MAQMYLPTINIVADKFNLNISPIREKCYNITEFNRRTVVYDIELVLKTTDTTDTKYKATKLYYISDGGTNHFRGNLLLPFFCISNEMNDALDTTSNNTTNCFIAQKYPRDYKDGLLYKNPGNYHINIENIISHLKKISNDDENKTKELAMLEKMGGGVWTVLIRIIEIVDYLLAHTSHKIKNASNTSNDIPQSYFTSFPWIEDFDIPIYNDDLTLPEFTPNSTVLQYFNKNMYNFRSELLKFMVATFKNICKFSNVTYNMYTFNNSTVAEFNAVDPVCGAKIFDPVFVTNFIKYHDISNELYNKIKEGIDNKNLGDNTIYSFFEPILNQEYKASKPKIDINLDYGTCAILNLRDVIKKDIDNDNFENTEKYLFKCLYRMSLSPDVYTREQNTIAYKKIIDVLIDLLPSHTQSNIEKYKGHFGQPNQFFKDVYNTIISNNKKQDSDISTDVNHIINKNMKYFNDQLNKKHKRTNHHYDTFNDSTKKQKQEQEQFQKKYIKYKQKYIKLQNMMKLLNLN